MMQFVFGVIVLFSLIYIYETVDKVVCGHKSALGLYMGLMWFVFGVFGLLINAIAHGGM